MVDQVKKLISNTYLTGAKRFSIFVKRNPCVCPCTKPGTAQLLTGELLHFKNTIADIKNGWSTMMQISSNGAASKEGAIH